MVRFLVRRLCTALLVLFSVALLTFLLMHQAPGSPCDPYRPGSRSAGRANDPQLKQACEAFLGLDQPVLLQFVHYMVNAVQGDLGESYRHPGRQVTDMLLERWPYSLRVGLVAFVFTVVVGIPLGIIIARYQSTPLDYIIRFGATIGFAIPAFVVGLLVFYVFGAQLGWILAFDWREDTLLPYLAPGFSLGLGSMAFLTRLTRSTVLEIQNHDYIRAARARGLAEMLIAARHMLPNTLLPIVTSLGFLLVDLTTGSVIIESIFRVPGIGRYFVESIGQRDYPLIMGTTLLYTTLIVLATFLTDVCYVWLDPRIRIES